MVCVVEMNEIENANSESSMVICIFNGKQTSEHLSDLGKARDTSWGRELGLDFF